jgi:cytochrome c553
MASRRRPLFRTWAKAAGATIAAVVVGGFLIASSGLYDVAASRPHWPFVEWFLEYAMRRSVETHALFVDQSVALADPDLVRLGAGHFHTGCAICHGAPGAPAGAVFDKMQPRPPNLSAAVASWSDAQLFRLVKHGLKYTGMPAWPAPDRDDEVWSVVAFLRHLPSLDAEGYRRLVLGATAAPEAEQPDGSNGRPTAGSACARCHGDEAAATVSRLVPILTGQSQDYLAQALEDYATGLRDSGIMGPIAAALDKEGRRTLAAHYAALAPAPPSHGDAVPDRAERGRTIASRGVPGAGVPACDACHGERRLQRYPALAGQHARYAAGQLRLWQQGLRDDTPGGALMATIARRLSEEQIVDVSLFYESLGAAEQVARE